MPRYSSMVSFESLRRPANLVLDFRTNLKTPSPVHTVRCRQGGLPSLRRMVVYAIPLTCHLLFCTSFAHKSFFVTSTSPRSDGVDLVWISKTSPDPRTLAYGKPDLAGSIPGVESIHSAVDARSPFAQFQARVQGEIYGSYIYVLGWWV